MRKVRLPDGAEVPALGQGTWGMGEDGTARASEIRALRHGLGLGLTLVDTAEMYGEGGAEEVVGEAVRGARDAAFIVTKAYPQNAGARSLPLACERSLKRLGTDRIDLYLLHWRGRVPLAETAAAFERLVADGKIMRWGVSNLDRADMEELWAVPGGANCAANQILYNLLRRGPEWDLLPWLEGRGVATMAYSPVEQGRLPPGGALAAVATKHGVDAFAVAIAWTLRRPGVIAIPKAGRPAHVDANARAAALELDAEDLAALDRDFPPPSGPRLLETL